MNSPLASGATIGIVGGGQLGRMLAMAAARLGFRTIVLEPQADCPAAQVANAHIAAAYDDVDALAELARRCDVVTYEFENVPIDAAASLANGPVPLHPPARALEVSQDRLTEKTFLNGIGIATAGFRPVDGEAEARAALQALGGAGILKTRRLGYDGKGQARLSPDEDAAVAFRQLGGVPAILEALVDFHCEISVVAARDGKGNLAAFEPARNVHRDGILRVSSLPSGVALATEDMARAAAFRILEALDYVGVMGVEFFVMRDGAVLVNEIAPRVHNSGHWTEAACAVNQFEQHVRAICGLPLGSTARHSDCVMENLIGDDVARCAELLGEPGVVLHLYGKAEARPGRKMGHFTRLAVR
ncbi:5-(carboxyamino)imidazole ribonucleotide synthase [Chelativorans sp. ZYF759]|uniref:5-(carboxyamino)imidazole ribonucleotide synthase n=1 Tax=Chelativorans sp. ZYF759 TaxID=2692213 RepID=UPI00145F5E12|nr:5-(carboxyamino)imidazole ribonucleotide synthase [Chelativorans sp. ZYF759]NMG40126.1 5-(carboxyamino)imidazole ribonucleotide synthase [Chelativorans sp. ZYF759]